MGVKQAEDSPATATQLGLGVLVVVVIAMTYRRLREEHLPNRHKPSKRSAELTRGGTPAHILEHIARINDPEYICLSIAENKLTIGPLLKKLAQLADVKPPGSGTITRNMSGILSTADSLEGGDGEQQQPYQQPCYSLPAAATAAAVAGRSSGSTRSSSSNKLNTFNERGYDMDTCSTEEYATTPAASSATISSVSSEPGVHTAAGAAGAAAASSSSSSARIASMGYGDTRGPLWVRRAVAEMMGERIFHRDDVDPDNLVIAAGATSVLRLLVVSLTEEGQGCIIPGPYFPGFDKVLNVAGVKAWVANRGPDEGGGAGGRGGGGVEGGADEGISPRVLQAALRSAKGADVEVRVLLITSPHNPTGRLYSPKALLAAIAWGRKRGLHIIVDEVYANCVHRPNAVYRSVGRLLMTGGSKEGEGEGVGLGLGDDVHVLYGLSKDLGVAGWRVGVLYSENKEVVSMVSKMAHTSQASSDTMDLVGRLFLEPGFLDEFFRQHHEILRVAYVSLMNQLGRRGILHLQAEAGLFVMLDLREFLESSSKEAEETLWLQMLERTKVNLTPGTAFHCLEPGWFRLCFAYQPITVVSRAVDRIADFLEALIQERAAAREELEIIRLQQSEHAQRQQRQQQQQRQQRQRQPLGGVPSAVAATVASAAAYVSAAMRRTAPPPPAASARGAAAAAEGNGSNRRARGGQVRSSSSTTLGYGSGMSYNGGRSAGRARTGMWGRERESSSSSEGAEVSGGVPGRAATGGDGSGLAGNGDGDGKVRPPPPESAYRRPVVDTVPW